MTSSASATQSIGQLEQFLLLCKDTSGKATAAIIQQVLRHKNIFVFGELFDSRNVQQLKGTSEDGWFRLLEIFTYGTYEDYKKHAAELPKLSDFQLEKLRRLTIVTLASKQKVLRYEDLAQQIGVDNVREMEDIVINCIYSDLLKAKLNQREKVVEVQWTAGRDVHPDQLDDLLNVLDSWCSNAERLQSTLKLSAVEANAQIRRTKADKDSLAKKVAAVKKELAKEKNKGMDVRGQDMAHPQFGRPSASVRSDSRGNFGGKKSSSGRR